MISWKPSESMSWMIGVERIASVTPRLTRHAIFASLPEMIFKKLSLEPSTMVLEIITGNSVPCPHRSRAACDALMLCEKSPMTEP